MSATDANNANTDTPDHSPANDAPKPAAAADDKPAAGESAADKIAALEKKIEALTTAKAERPPSMLEQLSTELAAVKSQAIGDKQEARANTDTADDLRLRLRKIEIVDAAEKAQAHNPNLVADLLIGRDGEASELVAGLKDDKSNAFMFKTPTDPDMTGGGVIKHADAGIASLAAEIAADNR